MGNHEDKAADGELVYCMKHREIRLMNEIWKAVETDLIYYGTQFYAILFHNHPEYFRYFQENMPHEFQVDIPAMRTKFSLTCSTLAALFGEVSHKSKAREHLLGYVAMVHKDMNLTQKDMENFMMDMMEMLMQKFPKLMTADCCLTYIRYTASLTSRLHVLMKLMKKQQEASRTSKGLRQMENKYPMGNCFRSVKCTWLPCNKENLIYGRTAEYWDKKSRHWIVQRAVWATMYKDEPSGLSRKKFIPKNASVNISSVSTRASSSSDEVGDEGNDERRMKKHWTRKKRPFRKQRNFSDLSNDDVTDVDTRFNSKSIKEEEEWSEIVAIRNENPLMNRHLHKRPTTPQVRHFLRANQAPKGAKSGDYRWNESDRGRSRRVSIVNSTARERRRRSQRGGISAKEYLRSTTRRLKIQNGIGTADNEETSFSLDEPEERDFRSNVPKSPNAATNKMRDRGTSISNISKQSNLSDETASMSSNKRSYTDGRPRASFSVKSDPPSSIIGSIGGRSTKSNKRVSISNAQWFTSRELDE